MANVVKDHLGKMFSSETAMCKAHGLSLATYKARRKRGLSMEEALENKNLRVVKPKVDHLGNKYISIGDMAMAYGIDKHTLISRLYKSNLVDHLGNKFDTLINMCKCYGIEVGTYFTRLNNGWSLERILTTPLQDRSCVDHLGKRHESLKALSRAYNLDYNILYMRIRQQGWSIEEAITTPITKSSRAIEDHKGNKYASKRELCKAYGIGVDVYYRRLAKGWSLEDILTTKVRGYRERLVKLPKESVRLF